MLVSIITRRFKLLFLKDIFFFIPFFIFKELFLLFFPLVYFQGHSVLIQYIVIFELNRLIIITKWKLICQESASSFDLVLMWKWEQSVKILDMKKISNKEIVLHFTKIGALGINEWKELEIWIFTYFLWSILYNFIVIIFLNVHKYKVR